MTSRAKLSVLFLLTAFARVIAYPSVGFMQDAGGTATPANQSGNPRRAHERRVLRLVVSLVALGIGFLLVFLCARPALTTVLRPGFEDRSVVSVGSPTALTFTPDGRMLITSQSGQLRVYRDGELLATPALDLSNKACTNRERGLLGVAVDPDFANNHYVYLYYTFNKFGACPTGEPTNADNPVNRVSRFVMSGNTLDPNGEQVLIDNIPSPNGTHNGGDLHFGKDGYLYVSVGDGACDYAGDSGCAGNNDASRDRHVLVGKILRITRDGGIPPDNPYTGPDSARCGETGRTEPGKICQETFAWGLRNPFRMAFDPDAADTRFFVNDVGQNAWEEIDEGEPGTDYGWNLCEGTHDNPQRGGSVDCSAGPYAAPLYEYSHDTGCSSITGSAFVPDGSWPASYDDAYLFGDYVCGKIFELKPDGTGGFMRAEFATGLGQGGPVAMAFKSSGTDQGLYYTTYTDGGEVHRISYTGSGRPPDANLSVDPASGPVPLRVSFDGSGSVDPDGDPLVYIWDFGDGTPSVKTETPTTEHTYMEAGTFTATLRARDTTGAEDTATVRIEAGNTAPTPTIESPDETTRFGVGDRVVLQGRATDPEDGELPDGTLSWEVVLHHDNHTHPFLPPTTGNGIEITAPAPEDLAATETSYLEIRLTATDSHGLSRTITQELRPKLVDVTFDSQPSGIPLLVNGMELTTPQTIVSWEGYELKSHARRLAKPAQTAYWFDAWSDGGKRWHDILTGGKPSTYIATYKACTATGTYGSDVISGTPDDDVICGLGGDDKLSGVEGNDILAGGPGEDKLTGGAGNDSIVGGRDTDELLGGGGDDTLNTKDRVSGNDSLDGGFGTDNCVTDASENSVINCP